MSRWMLACVVLLATTGTLAGRTQPVEPLFVPSAVRRLPDTLNATPRAAVRSRIVRIAPAGLASDTLLLNLFDEIQIIAARQRVDGIDAATTWTGEADGEPLSAVTFVRAGAIVQGSVRSAAGDFTIEPLGDGPDHVIRQVERRSMPRELVPLVPPVGDSAAEVPRAAAVPDDGLTIDVLAVYTAAARLQAGGSDAAVKARIALGVAETNIAYADSGVTQRLRLVGSELVGYRESGDLSYDLQALTALGDGVMDVVHARRNAVSADVVQLVVGDSAGGACGIAWVMQSLSTAFASYAFSVSAYPCISPNYTFGHELAHNMGSAHAPDDPNATPFAPYSYGYKDPGQAFRTVMAYDCEEGCPRILHFSNPSVDYNGKPTGSAGRHDNALSLNHTAATVANFRESRTATPLGAPRDLTLTATGTSVTVAWGAPSVGAPTGYVIEVGSEEGLANAGALTVNAASRSLFVPYVPPGSYYVRVRAVDAGGPGPPSTSVHLVMTAAGRCIAPPGPPALFAAAVSGSGVQLAWAPPDAGGPVDRYVIGASRHPESPRDITLDAGAATALSTTASPGLYFVRVAAVNACGPGMPSNEISVAVGPPIPGPPLDLVAGVAINRTVTLTWQPSLAGGTIRQYVVEAGSAPGLSNIGVLPTGSTTPAFSILAPAGRYYVRVRAVNEHGVSVPSQEVILQVF